MTPQSVALVNSDSIKGGACERGQFRGERKHFTSTVLILKDLKGIQIEIWAGDTKLICV